MVFPSPVTDSWICSRLFSVLWLLVRIVRIRVRVRVNVNRVRVRMGRNSNGHVYLSVYRTETNTDHQQDLVVFFF